ncbi:hypothetical protein [Legionella erythra]|uniref:Dot/Icm T4SS effector n=1 Tax=Legionella erythra TaxID=448 RepID=A0A0W0TR52_LEGER|nr:hypothetical protein [Legionella erythra]KTC98012.1 hypothetical protein Lery_1066 [Legionella erythra]
MKSLADIENLLKDFGQPGDIPVEAMALSLHAKRHTRQKKGSDLHAFAMLTSEISELDDVFVSIIDANACDFTFQIAVGNKGSELTHWSFMEFAFKANPQGKPECSIFICDPLGLKQSVLLALLFSRTMKLGGLAEFCDITVYLPTTTLQIAGRTCPYFALDSIAMLSTQSQFENLYLYMRDHENAVKKDEYTKLIDFYKTGLTGCFDDEEMREIHDFRCVVSPLPPRLLRTTQSLPIIDDVLSTSGDKVVNAGGVTFKLSTSRYRLIVEDRYGEKEERNLRVNSKMKQQNNCLRAHVATLSGQTDIESPDEKNSTKPHSLKFDSEEEKPALIEQIGAAIRSHRMAGLNQWVNESLALKAMSTLKLS